MMSPYEIQFMRTREIQHRQEQQNLARVAVGHREKHDIWEKMSSLFRHALESMSLQQVVSSEHAAEQTSTTPRAAS